MRIRSKSADERELSKLVAEFVRAQGDLARAEADLVKARDARADVQDAAASFYLDESSE